MRSLARSTVRACVALITFAALVACGGNSSPSASADAAAAMGDDASTGLDASGTGDATTITDALPDADATTNADAPLDADAALPPLAQGDPCRGMPLPDGQFYAAPGLCARVVTPPLEVPLRQIAFSPDGDLFGVLINGAIMRFHDVDSDGVYEPSEITIYANTTGDGNNCHIDVAGGYLYAGAPQGVKRFPWSPGASNGGAGEDVVIGQTADGHPYHTVHVYDGYLYVHFGSVTNMVAPLAPAYDTARAVLKRFKLASFVSGTPFTWDQGEVVTVGLRNVVGYTMNAAGRMYGVVNGMDDVTYQGADVHNDNPGEQVLELGMGKQYGYPFCMTAQRLTDGGNVVPAGTQVINELLSGGHDDPWCAANSLQPVTFLQAHSAPLDILFFDVQPRGALPEAWRGGAFVTSHGSWDRQPPTGSKVVWIPFDAQGKAPMPTSTATATTFPYQVVFGGGDQNGPKDGPWAWSASGMGETVRPVGVAISPVDGALYVSSDTQGYVYRVGVKK